MFSRAEDERKLCVFVFISKTTDATAFDNLFVDFSRGVTESFSFILWIAPISPLNRWKRFTRSFVNATSLIHKSKEGSRRKRNRLVLSDQVAIEWRIVEKDKWEVYCNIWTNSPWKNVYQVVFKDIQSLLTWYRYIAKWEHIETVIVLIGICFVHYNK